MTIEERDIDRLRDHLTKKFRSGNKWVAYTYPYDFAMVTCFRDIKSVHRLCESIHGRFSYFKFKPIIDVLKVLSGANLVAARKIDPGMVVDQVERYPIGKYSIGHEFIQQLAEGGYNPVNWKTQINPAMSIDKYHIVTHASEGLHSKHNHQVSVNQSFSTYREAETAFQFTINGFSSLLTTSHPEILLIGQMKGKEFKLGQDGKPKENTGIELKRAYRLKEYSIIQVNDLKKPVDIYIPMMAKFNVLNSNLEFFDGQLQKVSPGAKIDYMNFDLLSNDRVSIKNAISLSDRFKQNDQDKEGRQQNRLRPSQNL